MPFTVQSPKARRLLICCAALLAFSLAAPVSGQGFPDKPVRLVVPYAPGGSADVAARLISDEWGKRLGQPVVDNASGNLGMDAVAKSRADGYALSLNTFRAPTVTGPKPSTMLPEVPTMAEAGLPNYVLETWFVMGALAVVSQEALGKLNQSLNEVLNAPEIRARLAREGFDAWPQTSAQSDALIRSEYERWKKLVAQKGIKAD